MANNGRTAGVHLPHHPKVEGLSPGGTVREKWKKVQNTLSKQFFLKSTIRYLRNTVIKTINMANNGRTVVEHLPHHTKAQGSSPTSPVRENGQKTLKHFVINVL